MRYNSGTTHCILFLFSNFYSFLFLDLKKKAKMNSRPQTSTSRNEAELKSKALKEMAKTKDPVEKFRLFALSRGAKGIMGMGR